jgi:hypothetical protein
MKFPKPEESAAFIKRHLGSVRLAGITALVVAMSAWTTCSARDATAKARTGIDEAVAVRAAATRITQQFVPATTAETDEWARTTAEVAEFGTADALKVSLAQTVSRIGEVAGLTSVRASFVPTDSVGGVEPRNIGELTFAPASFGLRLEGNGSIGEVARVILRLPPATEITSLTLGGDGDLKATFQLAVYQPAGGPQN